MSEVLAFIPDDGYSESGVLFAVPGLYPSVRLEWRPMTQEVRAEYYKASEKLQDFPLRRLAAGYLAKHLKSWDLKNRKGEALPVNQTNALRVKEKLFNRMFRVVLNEEPPDLEPDRAEEDKDADVADALRAAETGRTVGEVREERERGNSRGQSSSS
jgi:hypothetical protein